MARVPSDFDPRRQRKNATVAQRPVRKPHLRALVPPRQRGQRVPVPLHKDRRRRQKFWHVPLVRHKPPVRRPSFHSLPQQVFQKDKRTHHTQITGVSRKSVGLLRKVRRNPRELISRTRRSRRTPAPSSQTSPRSVRSRSGSVSQTRSRRLRGSRTSYTSCGLCAGSRGMWPSE